MTRFVQDRDAGQGPSPTLNAVPIVVVVSVFQNWYPSTSEMPRRLVVAVVATEDDTQVTFTPSGNAWGVIRDEIREIEPGFYLGKVYWDKKRLIDFALK